MESGPTCCVWDPLGCWLSGTFEPLKGLLERGHDPGLTLCLPPSPKKNTPHKHARPPLWSVSDAALSASCWHPNKACKWAWAGLIPGRQLDSARTARACASSTFLPNYTLQTPSKKGGRLGRYPSYEVLGGLLAPRQGSGSGFASMCSLESFSFIQDRTSRHPGWGIGRGGLWVWVSRCVVFNGESWLGGKTV